MQHLHVCSFSPVFFLKLQLTSITEITKIGYKLICFPAALYLTMMLKSAHRGNFLISHSIRSSLFPPEPTMGT